MSSATSKRPPAVPDRAPWKRFRCAALGQDDRGTVQVEYTVVLALVAVGCALAIVSVGVPLLRFFQDQAALLSLPIP